MDHRHSDHRRTMGAHGASWPGQSESAGDELDYEHVAGSAAMSSNIPSDIVLHKLPPDKGIDAICCNAYVSCKFDIFRYTICLLVPS